jgi:protocatechuate 3,4-dioxygenase beta subunit
MQLCQSSFGFLWGVVILAWCVVHATATAQNANVAQGHAAGGYRIAGTIVNKIDSHPLARARVTLTDAKKSQSFQFVITSENGKFEFTGVPAGKYSLSGRKRGFIAAAYDQHDQYSTAIVTGVGLDTETLTLRLAPDAIISGKVLDESGDPVRHAQVLLYYNDHSAGADRIHQINNVQTDDQGAYEITPIRPGTYYLSASAQPWYALRPPADAGATGVGTRNAPAVDRSLDVAYPLTFYPDVTDADSAAPIPLRGGDHLQIDIHLNPVPALRLLFHLDTKTGAAPQLQQTVFDEINYVQGGSTNTISPGLFEISGVPAGHYDVRLPNAGTWKQMDGVDLSRDGQEIDTTKAETLSEVKVTVQIPGESKIPTGLVIGLRAAHKISATGQSIDAKGEGQFQQLAPGTYEIVVEGGPQRYSITQLSVEGTEVPGHAVTIPAGWSPTISITLVAGDVEVDGVARKAGHPFAGAMVVLVPKNPEMNHSLFRRDQSDLDGTFTLHGVVPGSYTLLAVEDGWDLDWLQPSVISAYLKRGEKIQVQPQPNRHMNVVEAVAVQSK